MNPEEANRKSNKPSKFGKKRDLKNNSFLIYKSYGVYGFGPNLAQAYFGDHKPKTGKPETRKRQTINLEKGNHE